MKKIIKILGLLVMMLALFSPTMSTEAKNTTVYKVPVTKEVEKGMYAFLKRSIEEAEEANADLILLDMHTPGGFVDAAGSIAKLIDTTDIRIITYINDDALSAGAFLALYADEIYMSPRGRIGAAQVITSDGNAADTKADSAWLSAMENAAESSGKNPEYARAMADPTVDLSKYGAKEGKLLTLTASQAKEVGYSAGTFDSVESLLEELGFSDAKIVTTKETLSESIARFVTNPIVVPILLSVAGLGLVVELYSPGFGIAGSMSITSLLLFFYGHLIAGLAGYETLILFIIGVVLLIVEIFVAGGIAGFIGLAAVIGSIILAGANPLFMSLSVLTAIAIATIGAVILIKFFGKKLHLLNRLVLMDATDTESGYVSNVSRLELVGQEGLTLTVLRPSGTVELADERIDVVSEGGYIDQGKHVKIIKVEGSRIVVREITSKEENEQ